MIKAIIPAYFINLIYFCSSVNKNKIAKYSILFNTDNDKKYIENMSENVKKSKEEFDKMLSNNNVLIIDGKFVEKIMREKGYFELFSQELKNLLGSGYKL